MKKILISIIIMATLSVGICPISIAKENSNEDDGCKNTNLIKNEEYDPPFWVEEAINYFINEELLYLGSDPKFNAQIGLSRGEFVLLLMRCLDKEKIVDVSEQFDDVDYNAYYSMAIYNAKKEGLLFGDGKNRFYPDRYGTRQEFVTILYRAIEKYSIKPLPTIKEYPFKDTNFSEYAKEAIIILHELGIIQGYGDGCFYPAKEMTRAEVIKVIYEVMVYLDMVEYKDAS